MNQNPFRYFKTSPVIIQLAVMMYIRFPLSFRNVEDLLHERGVDVCHESVRLWPNLRREDQNEARILHATAYSMAMALG